MSGGLLDIIKESRRRDRVMGYSLKGVHKDDLIYAVGGFSDKAGGVTRTKQKLILSP